MRGITRKKVQKFMEFAWNAHGKMEKIWNPCKKTWIP
jgi:hypothetical protein